MEQDFIKKITGIIEENISDEQFGVSELAAAIGMSRSNLLRKIKKQTGLSASRFISQVRLERAKSMLKKQDHTVSEVSFKVGFNSTSYFIKCFREHFGYPPGELGKRMDAEKEQEEEAARSQQLTDLRSEKKNKRRAVLKWPAILLLVIILIFILYTVGVFESIGLFILSSDKSSDKKSIAVLPFINDSDDSTNVYIINGLMESTLNDLQKIEDLRVISRTSVEKYRNIAKTIPEIARDLNVKYIVEGSGQKIGDQIMLHIQLIDAPVDRHLWSKQYRRESRDIFQLQMEVANDISNEIEAIITPEEKERIRKIPTDDLLAYDFFLKGQDLLFQGTLEGVEMAIPWFMKAIKQDPEFAHAYADISISYFYLEAAGGEGSLSDSINYYADQALLFDPKLPQSLIAKALFFLQTAEYDLAVPYLEKALEYSPNSAIVIQTLSEFYAKYLPDTEKYLMYALKGIQLDIASHDSGTISNIYLHLSNAFIQSGFVDEAEKYIKRSLDYNPDNLYSDYVGDYIRFANDRDLIQLKDSLTDALRKDTSRLDILQEVGKVYYYLRNFEASYAYYSKFNEVRDAYNLNIYPGENAKIALVLDKVGLDEESEKYFQKYKSYADADESIYKNLSLAAYYSYHGDAEQAIEFLRLFSLQDHYHYWMLIFIEIDPLFDNIQDRPEFRKILDDIETRFWEYHHEMKASLEEKELL